MEEETLFVWQCAVWVWNRYENPVFTWTIIGGDTCRSPWCVYPCAYILLQFFKAESERVLACSWVICLFCPVVFSMEMICDFEWVRQMLLRLKQITRNVTFCIYTPTYFLPRADRSCVRWAKQSRDCWLTSWYFYFLMLSPSFLRPIQIRMPWKWA